MSTSPNPYRGFRFPAEIISEAVWLYHRFSLSLREVELILAARGIEVSYETIREWGPRFGREFANTLKRRRPKPDHKWFLDEVFIRIRGKQHYLWRAVDQNGVVLDILVQSRRNTKAAKRFFRKLLKGLRSAPRVVVTDKLKSYAAATPTGASCTSRATDARPATGFPASARPAGSDRRWTTSRCVATSAACCRTSRRTSWPGSSIRPPTLPERRCPTSA